MESFYIESKEINKNINFNNIIKKAKIILPVILIFFIIYAFPFVVLADNQDDSIFKNDKAQIDCTNTDATGDVKINVVSKLDKRVKVTIEKGDTKYTYDLKNDTTAEIYPIQFGNGDYTIKVWIQAGEKYALALSAKYTVKLADPNAPFLNPSQYVNFNKDSKAVKIAADLTKNCTSDIDEVQAIYNFVISSLVYDTQKAQTVQSGYLPSVDAIIASGKGICFDYAAVFAAMLRSQGIPAKLVTGYVQPNNAYHAWNEFYIKDQGWFKINDMKFDGKQFDRVDPTFDSTSKSSKKVMQFIGDGSNYSKFLEY
ncbi:MAG: transglutaminase-like domain-containing protein [Oscillospiraceae bacterium]|nr:transglutaminase-like domain-containing protein [Oscillospiraceae bacterium]